MTNPSTFDRVVRECMVATGLPRAEAERAVRSRYPALCPAPAPTGAAAGGDSAERELEQRAKQIMAARRCTYAQAYVEALNADPELYIAYLRQKQSEVEAAARRG